MHDTTSGTTDSRTATRDLPHERDDQVKTDPTPASDSPFGATVIDAQDVGFAYGDHVILDGFNLNIKAGEIVALIGPSGCGKSTFLNLIAGIITPTKGELDVHGAPVKGLTHSISYMTQQDTLLPWRTALDNAALPLEIKHGSEKVPSIPPQ